MSSSGGEAQPLAKITLAEKLMIEEVISFFRKQVAEILQALGSSFTPEDISKALTAYVNTTDIDIMKLCLQYVHKTLLAMIASKCVKPGIEEFQNLASRLGQILRSVEVTEEDVMDEAE